MPNQAIHIKASSRRPKFVFRFVEDGRPADVSMYSTSAYVYLGALDDEGELYKVHYVAAVLDKDTATITLDPPQTWPQVPGEYYMEVHLIDATTPTAFSKFPRQGYYPLVIDSSLSFL